MLFRSASSAHNFHTLRRSASRIAPRGGLEADERANLSAYKLGAIRKNGSEAKREVIDRTAERVVENDATAGRMIFWFR
jgi:hypothetical protein